MTVKPPYSVEVDGLMIEFIVINASSGPGAEAYTEPNILTARVTSIEEFEGAHGTGAVVQMVADPVDWAHGKYVLEDGGEWLLNQVD